MYSDEYSWKYIEKYLANFMELSSSSEPASHAATQEFHNNYGTRRFITVFTRALH
jgi:hypothetical protein